MSRIAGVISNANLNYKKLASELISGISSHESWTCAESGLDGLGILVWAGWRPPVIDRILGCIVAIDGVFYNRGELDPVVQADNNCNDARRFILMYKKYGFESALKKINGDFSISLVNESSGELFLARDRCGVKPLYYVNLPSLFAFASRPKGLFKIPGVTKKINERFVAVFGGSHYRYIDNVSEESPYEQIMQVPAAHYLRWSKNKISIKRYWDLLDKNNFQMSEQELASQYRELLIDAVDKRVSVSNGNAAFTLSGGLDSSSVLSCAVESTGKPQQAFSSVYRDKTYDESDEIKSMLAAKVSKWNPVEIEKPDVFELVGQMVNEHDEPVATATWLSHFLLCKEVSRSGFKTLFGGLGGDELNAGEYEHFFFHFADLSYQGKSDRLNEEIEKWALYHDHPIYRKDESVVREALTRMVDKNIPGICNPHIYRNSRYRHTINKEFYDLDAFAPVMDHPFESYLKNRTYQDIFRETAPCCLRAEDRQSTFFNIDRVNPFFDHRLVEFMFQVPGDLKIRQGVTKILLREAMKGILPEETRTRIKKTGWNAPAHAWFSQGQSAEALSDLLDSRAFKERGIYNVVAVKKLFQEHANLVRNNITSENHMMFFWQLINLDIWIQQVAS